MTSDEAAWRGIIQDRLDFLRTTLVAVALLAVMALGVAIYALLETDEANNAGRRAGAAQVTALDERIDRLESRIAGRATKNAVSDIATAQRDLASRVEALEKRPGADAGVGEEVGDLRSDLDALSQAVNDVGDSLEQLEERVAQLEAQPGQ